MEQTKLQQILNMAEEEVKRLEEKCDENERLLQGGNEKYEKPMNKCVLFCQKSLCALIYFICSHLCLWLLCLLAIWITSSLLMAQASQNPDFMRFMSIPSYYIFKII